MAAPVEEFVEYFVPYCELETIDGSKEETTGADSGEICPNHGNTAIGRVKCRSYQFGTVRKEVVEELGGSITPDEEPPVDNPPES